MQECRHPTYIHFEFSLVIFANVRRRVGDEKRKTFASHTHVDVFRKKKVY